MDGTYTGVVDRVVDGETAVILLEKDGEVIEQLDIDVKRLPSPSQVGGVLSVRVEDGEFVDAEYRSEETPERRNSLREQLNRLSKRLSDR